MALRPRLWPGVPLSMGIAGEERLRPGTGTVNNAAGLLSHLMPGQRPRDAERHIARQPSTITLKSFFTTAPMARLIYGDRDALSRYHTRRRWREWAPFVMVAMLAAGVLLVLALTAPIFRPLPVPGAKPSRDSHLDRFAKLVGFIQDSTEPLYESAELEASPRDSN